MFKYIKAVVILILLLLGAQLVNGQPIASSSSTSPTITTTILVTPTSLVFPSTYDAFKNSVDYVPFMVHNLWLLVCTVLVFIMHLGFTAVETGFNASKNAVNVIYKNIFTLAAGLITYAIIGFGLMYPGEFNLIPGWLGFRGFGLGYEPTAAMDYVSTQYHAHYTVFTDFLFQAMFAATSATIISGAVAGRIKMPAYMMYAAVVLTVIYPITGSWKWGGGLLNDLGFHDFAGSTLVHLVGATAALVAVLILGPRKGRFTPDAAFLLTNGHSFPLTTIGVLLLWFGWFGFNGGSVLSADPAAISLVMVNTALAGAAGCMAAMATATFIVHKLDATQALNGILGGLVGITAGADVVLPNQAILIGAIGGILVVLAVFAIERMGIDDPVSAIAVHGVGGVWGTLVVGIWGLNKTLYPQVIGVVTIFLFTFIISTITIYIIRSTLGLRSSEDVELQGADVAYHGLRSYPESESA